MATLLPNGKQTFLSQNGAPLTGGSVAFYIPGTTTLKDTYRDAAASTLNQNPVILDAAGQATIYGVGSYRQVVKDAVDNLIWDQVTADTSSAAIWAGTSAGLANAQSVTVPSFSNQDGQAIDFIAGQSNTGAFALVPNGGAAIPVKKDTAAGPAVLAGGEIVQGNCYRALYDAAAGIFHVTATPSSIPAGALLHFGMASPPLGWLACDGTSYQVALYPGLFNAIGYLFGGSGPNFNVPDAKGRTLASLDAGAGRLSFATAVGASGGEQAHSLSADENGPHNHFGNTGGQSNDHTHGYQQANSATSNPYVVGGNFVPFHDNGGANTGGTSQDHHHSIPFDGKGTAHNNVQPTLAAFLCIKT